MVTIMSCITFISRARDDTNLSKCYKCLDPIIYQYALIKFNGIAGNLGGTVDFELSQEYHLW